MNDYLGYIKARQNLIIKNNVFKNITVESAFRYNALHIELDTDESSALIENLSIEDSSFSNAISVVLVDVRKGNSTLNNITFSNVKSSSQVSYFSIAHTQNMEINSLKFID